MNDNEIHVVTRQETFNDLAVRELAKSRAKCMCCLQFKRCKKSMCKKCQVNLRLMNCMSVMSDYDLERMNNYITEYYLQYTKSPMAWMSHAMYVRTYRRFVLAGVLFVMFIPLLFFFIDGPFDTPAVKVNYPEMITRTIQKTQSNIWDLDKDGLVNCVDYAILFKLTWDKEYPVLKGQCQIIRNYNIATGMNHLFVKVNDTYVEPRAPDPYHYVMEDIWGSRFDPKQNRYGETDKWLREVRE